MSFFDLPKLWGTQSKVRMVFSKDYLPIWYQNIPKNIDIYTQKIKNLFLTRPESSIRLLYERGGLLVDVNREHDSLDFKLEGDIMQGSVNIGIRGYLDRLLICNMNLAAFGELKASKRGGLYLITTKSYSPFIESLPPESGHHILQSPLISFPISFFEKTMYDICPTESPLNPDANKRLNDAISEDLSYTNRMNMQDIYQAYNSIIPIGNTIGYKTYIVKNDGTVILNNQTLEDYHKKMQDRFNLAVTSVIEKQNIQASETLNHKQLLFNMVSIDGIIASSKTYNKLYVDQLFQNIIDQEMSSDSVNFFKEYLENVMNDKMDMSDLSPKSKEDVMTKASRLLELSNKISHFKKDSLQRWYQVDSWDEFRKKYYNSVGMTLDSDKLNDFIKIESILTQWSGTDEELKKKLWEIVNQENNSESNKQNEEKEPKASKTKSDKQKLKTKDNQQQKENQKTISSIESKVKKDDQSTFAASESDNPTRYIDSLDK